MTTQSERDFARIKEQVEELAGARGNKQTKTALRRGDLAALTSRALLSEQVADAPTMAQHNALQADVQAIMTALIAIATARA